MVGFGWLIAQLPYGVHYFLSYLIGDALYFTKPKRLRIAKKNIAACFPDLSDQERDLMLRKNMRSLSLGLFETLICRFGRASIFHKRFEVVGEQCLQEHQGEGKILLVFHCASMELCAAALFVRFPLLVVYRPHDNPVIDYTQNRRWSLHRGAMSETDQSSHAYSRKDVRGMVKALRQGKNLWIAADQDLGDKRSVFSTFFGVPAATPMSPAKLAQSGRALALPVSFTRPDWKSYRIEIHPPLEGYPVGDDRADADRFNQLAERIISIEPESYLWVHRRFKTRPDGEADFYADC